MKKILPKGHVFNPFNHDIERYGGVYDTPYQASCARRALRQHGWLVWHVKSILVVVAYRSINADQNNRQATSTDQSLCTTIHHTR